jgi:hypothetical protein
MYAPLGLLGSVKILLVSSFDVVSDVFVVCHVMLLWLVLEVLYHI